MDNDKESAGSCDINKPAGQTSEYRQELTGSKNSDVHLRTGKCPINAETPSDVLLQQDITPVKHFYVRCHGQELDLLWDTHSIGLYVEDRLVSNIGMNELKKSFTPRSIRMTLVCDGNRRKELNMIKRSNGFDWGCCAASTGIFEGVLLRDILLKFFDARQLDAHGYVGFESADKLTRGHYATSIPLASALESDSDILVAYALNGEDLTKEHGFPVRTVLPGCVGGRTVKWLSKIILCAKDSNNHYHLEDNSVFPPDVTSTALMSKTVIERSKQYDQEAQSSPSSESRHPFILHELNINSAILAPSHGEIIQIRGNLEREYELRGYAYDGGGRKILRVELTLDDGESWLQCAVEYPHDYKPEHGTKWYIMCKWRVTLPIWRMASSKHMSVRAWNQSCNTQAERHTWNILGMMNNAWYTIHINRKAADIIEVLHPVSTAADQPKGWMEQKYPQATRYEERNVPPIMYSREEVKKHSSVSDCWVTIDDKVYDLTDFLNLHPGGQASILAHAGGDVTTLFYDIHSEDTHLLKAGYVIGSVAQDVAGEERGTMETAARNRHPFLQRIHPCVTPDGKEVELNSARWTDVTLQEKIVINHDTRRFIFALSSPDKRMWLPWGKHINLGVEISDRMVVRPYTPIKPVLATEDNGTFQLVVKIYFPTDARPGGEMTQILEKLKIGEKVKIKGPEGVLWYLGNAHYAVHGHFFYCAKMNFIVGGSGITPALAILRAVVVAEGNRDIEIRLVFANKTVEDILCREELKELVDSSERLRICHAIAGGPLETAPHKRVAFASGHINTDILREHILPSDDCCSSCFLCGPPAMTAQAVLPALKQLGFDDDHIFEF